MVTRYAAPSFANVKKLFREISICGGLTVERNQLIAFVQGGETRIVRKLDDPQASVLRRRLPARKACRERRCKNVIDACHIARQQQREEESDENEPQSFTHTISGMNLSYCRLDANWLARRKPNPRLQTRYEAKCKFVQP